MRSNKRAITKDLYTFYTYESIENFILIKEGLLHTRMRHACTGGNSTIPTSSEHVYTLYVDVLGFNGCDMFAYGRNDKFSLA